jgi:peptide/nickel transport system substrate-binding protein
MEASMEGTRSAFEMLEAAFVEGRIGRRDFLRRSAGIGASSSALAVLASLGLPRPGSAQEKPKRGGTLIIGKESELDILDPHSAGGWVTWRVSKQMHEGLIDEDLTQASVPYPRLVPKLATSWNVSKDALTYTFQLRKGVKFHDGTPFDAAAVKFNVERCYKQDAPHFYPRANAYTKWIWQFLKEVKTPDEGTVQFVLKEPYGDFLRQLVQGGGGAAVFISPTALKKYGNEGIAEHPTGTGPFRFVQRVRGEKVVIERNKDYWGPQPYLDRIIDRPMPEPAARMTALQAGEVDMIYVPHPDGIADLRDRGFKLEQGPAPHVWYFAFNLRDKHYQDIRVRRAINMAIDREGMAKQLLKGTAVAARGLQAPCCPSYDPKFEDYRYDPAQARKLLAEAGFPNGFETVWQTSVDGSGQLIPVPMAEWIQRDLAKVGIKMKLRTYEWITYIGYWIKGMDDPANKVGGQQMSWGMTSDYWLDIVTHSAKIAPPGGAGQNGGYYTGADKLLDTARVEMDEGKRALLYRKANQKIKEDAPVVPIINDLAPLMLSPKVRGFVHAPEEWYDMTTVWLA